MTTATRIWQDLSGAVNGLYSIAGRAREAAFRLRTPQGAAGAAAEQLQYRWFALLLAAIVNVTSQQEEASDEASEGE